MSPVPESLPSPSAPPTKLRLGPCLGVAALVLLGTGLFAAAAIAQVRRRENAPPAVVLGLPAWQVATAGFVSTLAGGLWLRRLV